MGDKMYASMLLYKIGLEEMFNEQKLNSKDVFTVIDRVIEDLSKSRPIKIGRQNKKTVPAYLLITRKEKETEQALNSDVQQSAKKYGLPLEYLTLFYE